MSLKNKFEEAVAKSKSLPAQNNETLLQLYALFKQANSGDVTGKRPSAFDLKGRAKYDAWASLKGKSQEDAMQEYIDKIASLGS